MTPAAGEPTGAGNDGTAGIVGREDELEQLAGFIDGAPATRVLILSGAAGIGKTTLWEAAVCRARERDVRVVAARGSAAEAKLSLAGLFDLLAPVADEVLPGLPAPQQAALEVALLRADPGGRPPGPRTIATALLTALRALADAGPLLVAVEDAQWLDRSSQDALAFAIRRLDDAQLRVLLTARTGTPSMLLDGLERQALSVEVSGLSLGATRRLLAQRLGITPPRRLLVAIHTATAGNPFFALEIARQVAERGSAHVDEPLPIPDDLPSLVGGRVAALPATTRELLLAAALGARPSAETLRRLLGRPLADHLDPAERAGIAFLRGGRLLFTHPLHAAATVNGATTAERREMHSRLADVAEGLEERARHLALSVEGSDDAAATTVSAAAREALSRGAFAAAAELAELAVELGRPDSPAQPQRLLDLAAFLRLAGEPARGHAVLADAAGWSGWPPALEARGRGQLLLATYWASGATAAVALGEQMLAETLDDQVRATVHTYLGGCSEFDLDRSARHIAAALELLEQPDVDPDPGTVAHALALRVRNRVLLGEGLDSTLLDRVAELETQLPPERFATEAMSPYLAVLHKHVDDLATSRERLQAVLDEATNAGNDVGETVAGMHLALTELWAGDLVAAEAHLAMVEARVEAHGTRNVFLLAVQALLAAHKGDEATVRRIETALETEHGAAGAEVYGIYLGAATGLLELSLGRYEAADASFTRLLDALEAGGHREPGIFRVHANAGEAAVATGDLERAERIAQLLRDHAERTGHRWSRASAARISALAAAAKGELATAAEHAERACAGYEALGMPLERARAVLVGGLIERRARRRARARELLEEAVREFERLGAQLWAERARAELGRVSGRRRRDEHELTPSEARVVELAAEGLSNKEIAKRLFVTVHTVELHLSHAYAKLGVRSRAQLAVHAGRSTHVND